MYYTCTKDFKSFTKTRLLYNKGFHVIDATIQQNGKEYVMFLKDETKNRYRKTFVLPPAKLNKGYSKASKPITGKY